MSDSLFSKLKPPETLQDKMKNLEVEEDKIQIPSSYDTLISLLEKVKVEVQFVDDNTEEFGRIKLHIGKALRNLNRLKYQEEKKDAKG